MAKRNILVFHVQPLVDVRTNLMFATRVSDADGNVSYKDEQSITFTMKDDEGRDRLSQNPEDRPVPAGAVRLSVEEE